MRYTIGAVAKAAGVNIDTVRYYERKRLLEEPPRSANGYRQYSDDTVRRIAFIKRAQRLGFSLTEASELLDLHAPVASCEEVERRIEAKVAQLEERIAALTGVKDALLQAVARCDTACETGCTVLLSDPSAGESISLGARPCQEPLGLGETDGCCDSMR